jgi:PEP-CTERM motif
MNQPTRSRPGKVECPFCLPMLFKTTTLFALTFIFVVIVTQESTFAKYGHVKTGEDKSQYMDVPTPVIAALVTEMWIFNDVAAHIINDPVRPSMVLGDSGPWTISLTNTDPFGNVMPYAGVKFILDLGGTPFDTANVNGVFVHTDGPGDNNGILTDIWRETSGDYFSDSGQIQVEWEGVVPPEITDTRERLEYIWADMNIPEPSTLTLLSLGAIVAVRRRRKA